jgi:hypothetical protein
MLVDPNRYFAFRQIYKEVYEINLIESVISQTLRSFVDNLRAFLFCLFEHKKRRLIEPP